MLNKKDKNNLIILLVLVAMLAYIVFIYKTTRLIPFKWIIVIYAVATVMCMGLISSKYLKMYGINGGVVAWIPIVNCINTFPAGVAIALIVVCVLIALLMVIQLIPVDILLKVIEEQTIIWFYDRTTFFLVCVIMLLFLILGAGYCAVLKDVRAMLFSATGLRRPKAETVSYLLLFIPIIAVMGYATIISGLNQLNMLNYSAVERQEEKTRFDEVEQ